MRADDVAFRADAEELALDGIEVVGPIDRHGEDFIEGLGQALARGDAIDRQVFHAVGDPHVGDAGLAQGRADGRADLRQAMPCSIQNLRMPVSGWASVIPSAAMGWAK